MAIAPQLTPEDEVRLAALWERPVDVAATDSETAHHGIDALFSSPDAAVPPTRASHAHRRAARRRPAHVGLASARAPLPRSRATTRWAAFGTALTAALALVCVALIASTTSTDTRATKPRAKAEPQPAATPLTVPSRDRLERRDVPASQPGKQRRQHRQTAIARSNRRRSHVVRPARGARQTRAQPRSPSGSRFVAHPPMPSIPTPPVVPQPTAPASSACDEFPPC